MHLSSEELARKAKEINDVIFGVERKSTLTAISAIKMQLDESAKFALQKALSQNWVSPTEKNALVEVIKERPDAINIFIVPEPQQEKSVEMLKPIFGYKSGKVLEVFHEAFNALQEAIENDRRTYRGA